LNKYMGFFELRTLDIPAVEWHEFKHDTCLDDGLLWTVRVAVENSFDIHLPRLVGATSEEALKFGKEQLEKYGHGGIVIYYPYFIAEKSGTLQVSRGKTVIEAIKGDLWNLVTYGHSADVTIILENNNIEYYGLREFLFKDTLQELIRYAAIIRSSFRDEMSEGKSILAEWSVAHNTDIHRKPIGNRYLVFFEVRSV
jgi:hypothetical protein